MSRRLLVAPARPRTRLEHALWSGLQIRASYEKIEVRDGPGAIQVYLYANSTNTHLLQMDFNDEARIDFRVSGKWIAGDDKVREQLKSNASDRMVFKRLAYALLNQKAGPQYARDKLEAFVEGLPGASGE